MRPAGWSRLLAAAVFLPAAVRTAPAAPVAAVDASSLVGKVMCGYQGWFRCPGDSAGSHWVHWSRDGARIAADTLPFEMWPDMREYPAARRYPAPGFAYPDGTPAELFSSADPETVNLHFRWMREYGIDGVFVQRFLVDLQGPGAEERASRVLTLARKAAERTGRVFAVDYDMTGVDPDTAIATMQRDWRYLVDTLKVTASPRYLRQNGKPVLKVFGFYPERMSADQAHRILDALHFAGSQRVFLVGAGPWDWRKNTDASWSRLYRRFDAYSPWNVGNYTRKDGALSATTSYWADDAREAARCGMLYLPVVYPGFSWDNLKHEAPGTSIIPRRRGAFMREQFAAVHALQIRQAYVAMFDEVDEGTAIFKVANRPPTQAHFVGLEGLPSDAYLRITEEGTRLIHSLRPPGPRPAKSH